AGRVRGNGQCCFSHAPAERRGRGMFFSFALEITSNSAAARLPLAILASLCLQAPGIAGRVGWERRPWVTLRVTLCPIAMPCLTILPRQGTQNPYNPYDRHKVRLRTNHVKSIWHE